MRSTVLAAASLALFAGQTIAHSWLEQLQVIGDDGIYTGPMGYPRAFVARGAGDPQMNQNQMPPLSRVSKRIDNTDTACRPEQQSPKYNDGFPMLKAAPGDFVAMKYLENGHTTHVDAGLSGAKADGSGSVYLFGTFEPKNDEKLGDILQWTRDGSGGDKRGKLMIAQNYDDNRCYQIPAGDGNAIYQARKKAFDNKGLEVWCESDLPLPADLEVGKTLTVYWVWDWPSFGNDAKDEYYTSCMDIEIVAETPTDKAVPLGQQDPNTVAVKEFKSRTAITNTPRTIGSAPTETSGPDAAPERPAPEPAPVEPAPTEAAPAPPTEEPAAPSPPPETPSPTPPPAGDGAVAQPPPVEAPAPTAAPPAPTQQPAQPPAVDPAVPTLPGRPDAIPAPPVVSAPLVGAPPGAPPGTPPVVLPGAPPSAPPGGAPAVPPGGAPAVPPVGGDAAGMTTVVVKETVYITGQPPAATPAPAPPPQVKARNFRA